MMSVLFGKLLNFRQRPLVHHYFILFTGSLLRLPEQTPLYVFGQHEGEFVFNVLFAGRRVEHGHCIVSGGLVGRDWELATLKETNTNRGTLYVDQLRVHFRSVFRAQVRRWLQSRLILNLLSLFLVDQL